LRQENLNAKIEVFGKKSLPA